MNEFLQQSPVAAHLVFIGTLGIITYIVVRGIVWLMDDFPFILRERKRGRDADRRTFETFVRAFVDAKRREHQREMLDMQLRYAVQAEENEKARRRWRGR